MESEKPDAMRQAEELRVSDDLLRQLHEANTRLHEARLAMEQTMDDAEPNHQHRVDVSEGELRAAEKALDEISAKIHDSLKPPPSVGC